MKSFIAALLFLPCLAWSFDHTHSDLTTLLRKHVRYTDHASTVNYQSLKTDRPKLNKYLQSLSAVSEKDFKKFSKNQQMAFLINAYNAFTLQLILDHMPIASIKKIGGWFKSPWKMEFIDLLGGKRHLDWIEHETLRKNYNEPRIHFAVNCASIGCPRLRNEAFTADQLEAQLDEQTRDFLKDKTRNRIEGGTLFVSKIFQWFDEDFTKDGSTVQKFVLPYMVADAKLRQQLEKGDLKLKYTDYDWDLNGL